MQLTDIKVPTILKGGAATDDRGTLWFNNDLDLAGARRFYIIENHQRDFIRGFHGHLKEQKIFVALNGVFAIVYYPFRVTHRPHQPSGTEMIREEELPKKIILAAGIPAALILPGGYMHATQNLTDGARLIVISDKTTPESMEDDFRERYSEMQYSQYKSVMDLFKVEER